MVFQLATRPTQLGRYALPRWQTNARHAPAQASASVGPPYPPRGMGGKHPTVESSPIMAIFRVSNDCHRVSGTLEPRDSDRRNSFRFFFQIGVVDLVSSPDVRGLGNLGKFPEWCDSGPGGTIGPKPFASENRNRGNTPLSREGIVWGRSFHRERNCRKLPTSPTPARANRPR